MGRLDRLAEGDWSQVSPCLRDAERTPLVVELACSEADGMAEIRGYHAHEGREVAVVEPWELGITVTVMHDAKRPHTYVAQAADDSSEYRFRTAAQARDWLEELLPPEVVPLDLTQALEV
jgi:hypothetical protein